MLGPKDTRLIRLFSAIVLGDWPRLTEVRASAPSGEPDRAWREAVLQSHLFAGFPRTVEAFEVLEEAGGLGSLDPEELEPFGGDGGPLFERIYAGLAEPVRQRLTSHHPVFAAWILDHAYGRVLSRPGLAPDRRELLAVAALAVTHQERQLMSHARGAVRCGASSQEVVATLDLVEDLIDPDHLPRLREVVSRFARE